MSCEDPQRLPRPLFISTLITDERPCLFSPSVGGIPIAFCPSPLSLALFLENQELIKTAVRILWQTFMKPPVRQEGSVDDSQNADAMIALRIQELARVFQPQNMAETENKKTCYLKELLGLRSRNWQPEQALNEMRSFVMALRDGYILCQFMNKQYSQLVVFPTPSAVHSHEQTEHCCSWLDNLYQFLLACSAYEIHQDDLFEPKDLITPSNGSLARVAATIIAISKGQKKRNRSLTRTRHEAGLEFSVSQLPEAPLRYRSRALQSNRGPRQARSWDNANSSLVPRRSASPNLESSSLQIVTTLFLTIFQDKEMYRKFLDLQGDLAQASLDVLQRIIDSGRLAKQQKTVLVAALLRLSVKSSLYPSCLLLKNVEREQFARACGRFGDVYRGKVQDRLVCIKMVKIYQNSQIERAFKAFSKEAILWNRVRHPNVLPFYGVFQLDEKYRRICLVSPWMENGNVREYLSVNPDVNRLALARDIVRGLRYLHGRNMIHGDLKGPNILIMPSGQACLADFGLTCISDPNILQWTSVESIAHSGGTVRWQAPELIDPETNGGPTKASDIYALGGVCYEILTGAIPFHEIANDYSVILSVMKGKRPSKPPGDSEPFTRWGLTEGIWSVLEKCWDADPGQRPTALVISQRLPRSLLRTFQKTQGQAKLLSGSKFRAAMIIEEVKEVPAQLVSALTKICRSKV